MLIKKRPIPNLLPNLSTINPILQRIFAARGIVTEEDLDKNLKSLLPFCSLTDIDKASKRLEQAIRNEERILIIGDFDADGATSSALAVSALRVFGAAQVDFLVPNRFEFGYGLTKAIVEVAKTMQPNLIITVDNGIASIEGVDTANEAGIDVLITDHHLPAETLPNACAIVNPNQVGDKFPSKSIAGVGVIFYVMLALRRQLVDSNWFKEKSIAEPNMAQFLDLVTLGTIADVVALDKNNRILINQGLNRIRQGLCRPGIIALIEIAGRNFQKLTETDLGYTVAPRLNAAGRLDDMSLGINCLLADDLDKAKEYAKQLNELNIERRKIETEMKEQALHALDKLALNDNEQGSKLPLALCLYDKSWHQGVIGILAGRLKEKYHRPAIIFASAGDGELKASARSIFNLNIRDVLAAIDKDNPGLIIKFGGHAMAAGCTIEEEQLGLFEEALQQVAQEWLDEATLQRRLQTDGPLPPEFRRPDMADVLAQEVWGQGFAAPTFSENIEVLGQRLVAEKHLSLKLRHHGQPVDGIWFGRVEPLPPLAHLAYRIETDAWQGTKRVRFVVEGMAD